MFVLINQGTILPEVAANEHYHSLINANTLYCTPVLEGIIVEILLILVIVFALSVLFTGAYRQFALHKDLLDHPNHRSSHVQPTPRGGGSVFCVLFLLCLAVLPGLHLAAADSFKLLGVPALLIALIGFLDDVKGLPAKLRFAVQLGASVLFLYVLKLDYMQDFHGWLMLLPGVSFLLILLAMVWSTNLYNFMDGTDGIASVEAITVYGIGGLLLWLQGAFQLAYLAWLLTAGVLGFLMWNWPKAKIFMGDVASSFLGFLIIPFALIGYFKFGLSIFVWFILYLSFTLDATLTLLRRLRHREKVYEAHKLHAYQRLHQAGYTHRQVLYAMIVINGFLAACALLALYHAAWLPELTALAMCGYLCFYAFVEYKKPMYPKIKEVMSL